MYEKELVSWFPTARIVEEELPQSSWLSLVLEDGRCLQVPKEELTARELFLFELLTGKTKQTSSNPWFLYLNQGGKLPQPLGALQAIYIHIPGSSDTEAIKTLLEMMGDLLTNQVTVFQQSKWDYVFVLDQTFRIDVEEIVQSVLPALEYDLGLKLAVFIGQIWPQQIVQEWPQIFQAEVNLFTDWKHSVHQSTFLRFSQVFILGTGQSSRGRQYLKSVLRGLLLSQDQLEETILALWSEAAVVTKAAQRLYVHRNTLQYRLEKWQDLTGLQLKELTDLTMCYQVLMEQ